MLTAVVTTPPVSAAVTCSAVTTPARSCASAVEAPRCGVTTTSSRSRIGCPVKGSSGKTSSAAPATLPDSSPSTSASRSISSPRAQLTIRTPSRIFPIASASMKFDGLRRLRQVERDEVGARVELVRVVDPLHPELAEALGGDELVVGDHRHLEGLGTRGDELADAPEAEHAEGLAVELGALELAPGPRRRRRARRGPAGCCGRARASAPSCARPRRSSSPRGRWRRRCRAWWPPRRRRCPRRCRRGRSP